MNANTLYYNMPSSASSASSSDKSIAVLIKKAMAKLPMSHNTKKSVDEYYKNAMKEIVMKIKVTEKAKKEKAKKEKAVKKPRAKKVGGGINVGYILREFEIADQEIKSGYYYDIDFINSITNIINEVKKYSDIEHIERAFTIFKSKKTENNAIEIMRLISSELRSLQVI
jgi:hypothetical protein